MSESEKVSKEVQRKAINDGVDQQIRHWMDGVRAREFWLRALAEIPPEIVADALAVALTSGAYQVKPTCRCCCQ